MRCRLVVLGVFALPMACSSHELAAVAPATAFHVHLLAEEALTDANGKDAKTPDVGEWSAAILPSEPVAGAPSPTGAAQDDAWDHHVTFFIGRRNYDDGNLKQSLPGPSELDMDHTGFKGLEIEGCDTETGHGYEVGAAFAYQTDAIEVNQYDYELTTTEFYGGYRYTFRTSDPDNCFHPFIGAGLSVIHSHFDSPGFAPFDDDASALAAYGRLGFTVEVGLRLRLGLDYRILTGTDDVNFGTPAGASSADLDHDQVAFTIGYLL